MKQKIKEENAKGGKSKHTDQNIIMNQSAGKQLYKYFGLKQRHTI